MPQPKDKTKVKEWKENISKGLMGKRCSMATEFAKGNTPWNKGTKGLMKKNKTSFKKGNRPKNYMGGMKICKDGIYVRVGNKTYSYGKLKVGKYESLARVKYRKAFGDFPKEMLVFHKDGDMLNNEIDNLELISRGENLKRNQYKNKKFCVICGLEFTARVLKSKTCSLECRKEYNKMLNKEWGKKNKEKVKEGCKRYREKMKLLKSETLIPKHLNTNNYNNNNNGN